MKSTFRPKSKLSFYSSMFAHSLKQGANAIAFLLAFLPFLTSGNLFSQTTVSYFPAPAMGTISMCEGGQVQVVVNGAVNGAQYILNAFPPAAPQLIIASGGTVVFAPITYTTANSYNISVSTTVFPFGFPNQPVTVVSDPVAPTLTLSQPVGTVCAGPILSATLNSAGTGGVNCFDEYDLRINNGAWTSYNLGDPISSTAYLLTSVDIRARRKSPSIFDCSAENIYTWNINSNVHDITGTQGSYCTIQQAIDAASTVSGDVLEVESGTYDEQVLVNKAITVKGIGITKPIINFTGTPALAGGALTLFQVTSPDVTIEGLEFSVDVTKLGSAILASSATLNNLTVTNNNINPYRSAAGTVTFGLRNAISVNVTPRVSSNNPTINVNNNTITYNIGFDAMAGTADDAGFRSGVATDEGGGVISLNTFTTISHDITARFGGNPSGLSITQNNFNGGGIDLADQNAACGPLTVSNNTFTGVGAPGTAKLRVRNNYDNIVHTISNNTFDTFDWAVSLENMRNVTLNGNTFNGDAATDRHVVVNTKSLSSNSNTIVQIPVDAVLTNNNFSGQGIGLTSQNHDSDNDSYGSFTIGSAGNANTFAAGLTDFIRLDNQTGTSTGSSFPTYPGTGGWPTTMDCWSPNVNVQNNTFDVGSGFQLPTAMNLAQRTSLEAKLFHKPDASCTGELTYFLPVQNLTQNTYYLTIQAAVNAAVANNVIECSEWTYNENVVIDKPLSIQGKNSNRALQVLDGTGITAGSNGFTINGNITGVTITNFTIQNFTGTGGNSAGIKGVLSNSNLLINNVDVKNNINSAGIHLGGGLAIDNVTITNSSSSNHGPGARGIVIWDGLKTNINISNNTVNNNNCCGIELQDGNASGVTISGNTIDIGSGDNGLGLTGMNSSIGPNLIQNNIITGGGRYGIEIKNPAGGVTVNGNTVTLSTQNGDARDRAGIAIFRRGVTAGNADVPNGVTITGNTVSGYQQTSTSEGFGIVVEGTNHTVTGNTVSGCEVGILQQQNPSNYPGDAVQNDVVDLYFGRGNSPMTCGNTISGNTLSSNGLDTRNVGVGAGIVTNTNSTEIFCSIQSAINDAQTLNGHTLTVQPGTYNEQVIVNKELTIKSATATKAIVNFTGTVVGKPTLFDVTANKVTIENLQLDVDLSKLRSAIIASSADLDTVRVKDNMISAYGTPAGSYGDRNAVSVNYGGPTNYRVATGGVNSVIFTGNTVTGPTVFRSAISLDEGGLTATGNTLNTINHDVLLRFASNGANNISNNNFNGGGVELADQNAGSGTITVAGNTFTGVGAPGTAKLRIKNNEFNIAHVISGNTFNTFDWGVSLENMRSVTLSGNTFTGDAATDRHVVVNTKSISSNSNTITQVPVDAVMTNNNFAGQGIGLTFQNHDSDNDAYGTFTIGSAGNANTFAAGLTDFIRLDNQTGTSTGSSFPTYPGIGGWPTTMDCWSPNVNVQNNTFDVGSGFQLPTAMNLAQRTSLEAKLFHKPDASCTGELTYFLPVQNLTQNTYYLTIQAAVNAAVANNVIECSEWTYNENVVIDKPLSIQGKNSNRALQVLDGTGITAGSNGFTINGNITGVTITNFTIQNFTGTGGNSAGIKGVLSNSNLLINNVDVKNNINSAGIHLGGGLAIDNVTITNSSSSNHGPGARGIVIWDGLKTNINISNNTVNNNNCCGIELQDGNASGVTISGNTIDIGSGDNGLGLTGMNSSIGPNLIQNNIITGGGRYGIEIKNPAGGVTVNGNTVTLSTQNGDARDRAGIAIFRRGVTAGNADVPNGVTITGNTVSGYQQTSTSEGFGIVVEGTNHTVTGNTVSGCEVGILQQQNPSNYPGDAVQNDVVDLYFGRGNSPMTCGNTISGNTLSSNGLDTRNVGVGAGIVTNTNSTEIFCSIQSAINDAQTLNGHTLTVQPGTYNEQVIVNKELTIKSATATKAIVNFTGTVVGKPTLFDVTANKVTIENLQLDVDLSKLRSAIIASSADLDTVRVKDNMISAYGTPAGSYGDRNAVSVNYGGPTNYRVATGGVNSVIFTGNTVTGPTVFRSAISLDEGGLTATGNTLNTINHDVLLRFASNGANNISNNNFNGGGVELADQNAGSGTITVAGNTFTGVGAPGTAKLRIKNNEFNIAHVISGNTFNTFDWGVSLENMRSVTLSGNTFTGDAATDRHVVVNTKSISSNSNTITQVPVDAVMTNNNFAGQGIGLTFQNHDSDNDTYGTFTIGSAGNANTFAAGLTDFIRLDNQTGTSTGSTFPTYPGTSGWPTTMDCWATDLNVQNNTFDLGAGQIAPVAMNATQRTALEAKLTHKPDAACLGTLRFYFPIHNVTQNTFHFNIQEAIDAASTVNGDVISVPPGEYVENVVVSKSLTINGPNSAISACSGSRGAEAIIYPSASDISGSTSKYTLFDVTASNVTISGFTLNGDNPSINTGKTSTNGADIDVAEGISRYGTATNLVVTNNIIQNLSYFGVTMYDFPAAVPSSGNVISNNKFQDLGTYDATSGIDYWGGGVLVYNNQYASITNNCMTNVRLGVQTGNFHLANPGAAATISNNTIQARRVGIFHNLHYGASTSPITLNTNTITALNNTNETRWYGIFMGSLSNPGPGSTASGNTINGSGTSVATVEGVNIWNCQATTTISGGTITGVKQGINVNNFEGYSSNADNTSAIIDGVTITNASIEGIKINDNPLNTNNATVKAEVKNCIVNGSPTAIFLSGSDASGNVHDNTINATEIGINVNGSSVSSTNPLILQNNSVTLVSQLPGVNPSLGIGLTNISGTQAATVLNNNIAGSYYGYLTYNVNTTPVTKISGGTITGIMQGIAAINIDPQNASLFSPSTIDVDGVTMSGFTGNYPSQIPFGRNFHAGVYVFTAGSLTTAKITSTINNVSVSGTGKIANDCAGLSFSDFSTGAGNRQDISVTACNIIGNLNRGINVRGANALVDIATSTLTGNGNDAFGTGGNDGFGIIGRVNSVLNIHNNFITNPASSTLPVTAILTDGATITATQNSLINSGNPLGKLATSGGASFTATCNWWGSALSTAVAGSITGPVTYISWLTSGADGAGVGFQPTGICNGDSVKISTLVLNAPVCNSPTGSLKVTFTGGAGPYNLAWNGGGSASAVTSPYDITGLLPGANTVTITDVTTGITHLKTETVTLIGSSNTNIPQAACSTYTWPVNGATYTMSGTYRNIVTNPMTGCQDTTNLILTIEPNPSAPNGNYAMCSGSAANFDLQNYMNTAGNGLASTFSWSVLSDNPSVIGEEDDIINPKSGSIIPTILTVTTGFPQTVVYRVIPTTVLAGCLGSSFDIAVTIYPIPNISAANKTICTGNSTALTVSNPNGVFGSNFSWTATYGDVTGGSGSGTNINFGANAIAETLVNTTLVPIVVQYTLTPIGAGPTFCNGTPITVNVTVTPNVGIPVISGPIEVCQDDPSTTFTATATSNTGITWSVSPVAAGVINASTGEMNWDMAYSGTATITATATGCNGSSETSNHMVTVNPLPTISYTQPLPVCVSLDLNTVTITPSIPGGTTTYHATFMDASTNMNSLSGAAVTQATANTFVRYTLPTGCFVIGTINVTTGVCVAVTTKAILQGPFNTTTQLMNDNLRAIGLIPSSDPYRTTPYSTAFVHVNNPTTQTILPGVLAVTGSDAIVDWVFVELRDKTDRTNVLATRAALIQRDGDIVDMDGVSPVSFNTSNRDLYFLAVKHRNHLATTTDATVDYSVASPASVDFSNSSTVVFGTNGRRALSGGSLMGMWSGNSNLALSAGKGVVRYNGSANDRQVILNKLGGSSTGTLAGYHIEDLNMNGIVSYNGSANDRLVILVNLGGVQTATITEQLIP
jgi:hypothetical protein